MATAAFVFPGTAGHVNPSLPLCRGLVARGWQVVYVCSDFRQAIEDAGAIFEDMKSLCAKKGIPDVRQMVLESLEEYEDPKAKMWGINFGSIATERLLHVFLHFFRELSPELVVPPGRSSQGSAMPPRYCPVLCCYAHFAAAHLGIRDVSLCLGTAHAAHGALPGSRRRGPAIGTRRWPPAAAPPRLWRSKSRRTPRTQRPARGSGTPWGGPRCP